VKKKPVSGLTIVFQHQVWSSTKLHHCLRSVTVHYFPQPIFLLSLVVLLRNLQNGYRKKKWRFTNL
jgi:hypothetical protein